MVAATRRARVARGEHERLAERYGPQILHVEGAGHGDDAPCAIDLAHGFVEEGRDNASVRMARRTGEAPRQPESADDVLVGIGEEAEAKPGGLSSPQPKQ